MVASPGYSRGGACLVHDNEVDGVLLRVLVLAEPDAEALRIKALEVLRKTGQRNLNTAGLCAAMLRDPGHRGTRSAHLCKSHTRMLFSMDPSRTLLELHITICNSINSARCN